MAPINFTTSEVHQPGMHYLNKAEHTYQADMTVVESLALASPPLKKICEKIRSSSRGRSDIRPVERLGTPRCEVSCFNSLISSLILSNDLHVRIMGHDMLSNIF